MSPSPATSRRATELADAVLDLSPGSALVEETGRSPTILAATPHRYGALVGVTCPRPVDAVAAAHRARLHTGGRVSDAVVGVAVTRAGTVAVRVGQDHRPPRSLRRIEGPLVDIGLRALGLATPACARRPLDLLDAAFAETVLRQVLDADLGCPPTWAEVSASHPLAAGVPLTAAELWTRRSDLAPVEWSHVRDRIVARECRPDPELTPSLALWLDDGALARWLFARHPEPDQMFADVCELLDPVTAGAFRAAHAPGFG